jgi:hypothetical protein
MLKRTEIGRVNGTLAGKSFAICRWKKVVEIASPEGPMC